MSMNTIQRMVEQLTKNNGGNIESLAAWTIGYIGSLEDKLNVVRKSLGVTPLSTLNDSLDEQINSNGNVIE